MTTKRSSLFRFILKTVLMVAGLALTAWLVLNLWSRWEVKRARSAFDAQTTMHVSFSATRAPNQGLLATTQVAKDIEWTQEERTAVGSASSLACRDWTPEQFETVQLVVERNADIQNAMLKALRETPQAQKDSEANRRNLGSVFHIVRLLTADARLALAEGNHERVAETFNVLKLIEINIKANSGLTGHIVSTFVRNLSNQILLDHLSWESPSTLDPAFLRWSQTVLSATPICENLRNSLIEDVAFVVGGLQESCRPEPKDGWFKTLIHPIVTPIFCRLNEAALMGEVLSFLDLIDQPFGVHPDAFEQPPRSPWWKIHRIFAEIWRPDLKGTVGRCQATAAQRQLLDAALAMYSTSWPGGAYPETRPAIAALTEPDSLSGQLLEYQTLEDGRLHLAVANGPELLDALKMSGRHRWLDPVVLGAPEAE